MIGEVISNEGFDHGLLSGARGGERGWDVTVEEMAEAMPSFSLRVGTGVGWAVAMAGEWGEHNSHQLSSERRLCFGEEAITIIIMSKTFDGRMN